jgi:hypothetical protein
VGLPVQVEGRGAPLLRRRRPRCVGGARAACPRSVGPACVRRGWGAGGLLLELLGHVRWPGCGASVGALLDGEPGAALLNCDKLICAPQSRPERQVPAVPPDREVCRHLHLAGLQLPSVHAVQLLSVRAGGGFGGALAGLWRGCGGAGGPGCSLAAPPTSSPLSRLLWSGLPTARRWRAPPSPSPAPAGRRTSPWRTTGTCRRITARRTACNGTRPGWTGTTASRRTDEPFFCGRRGEGWGGAGRGRGGACRAGAAACWCLLVPAGTGNVVMPQWRSRPAGQGLQWSFQGIWAVWVACCAFGLWL